MTTGRPAPTLAGGVRGVELYTRITLYTFVPLEGFFYLYAVAALSQNGTPPSVDGAGALLVAALGHIALCFATVHVGFSQPLVLRGRWRPVVVATVAAAVVVTVLALLVLPQASPEWIGLDPRSITIAVCAAGTLGALATGFGIKALTVAALVPAAITAIVRIVAGLSVSSSITVAFGTFLLALFWAGTVRLSMWVLEVVRELEESRAVAGRLAVAEERLRIARDMHDVVGRALSAVAVKSDLSAALARRGDTRAADEMDQVRVLAQESLREVRGVVAGYRAPDLATELAGARSVLRAAGIAVRVVGDVPALDPSQQEAFAWVVREGVTNVVRHSRARECDIRLDVTDGAARLRLVNDGVGDRDGGQSDNGTTAGPTTSDGTGIAGLRERLVAVGGTLDTTRSGDRFTLLASVPTPGGRP